MREVKDTKQASVHIGFDGRVHKRYHGPKAKERFQNEMRVLRYLEKKNCPFVPRLLDWKEDELYIVTTNCGAVVERISTDRLDELFKELETYGVRHEDPFRRNVTYSAQAGRFCLIDFELATIIETGEGLTLKDIKKKRENDE
jgi:tRNA A-37 threonylcarbamoyl transferase component Bud32